MVFAQPVCDLGLQFPAKLDELIRIRLRCPAGVVIFHRISFLATAVEVVGIALPAGTEDMRQGVERA